MRNRANHGNAGGRIANFAAAVLLAPSLAGVVEAAPGSAAPVSHPAATTEVTTRVINRNAFAQPLPGLTRQHRRQFAVGNNFFNDNWIIAPASAAGRDGLGPYFHARSCSACHPFDGRGKPPEPGELMTGLIFRLGTSKETSIPIYGDQLAPRAIPGLTPEGNITITYREVPGELADGTRFSLLTPAYVPSEWRYGSPPADLRLSPRVAMPVFGGGLLEAVADAALLARVDATDEDGDGISGRANYAESWDSPQPFADVVGRFGWKAGMPNLRRQIGAALGADIGITNSFHPFENSTVDQSDFTDRFPRGGNDGAYEAPDKILDRLVIYLRSLAPPARRDLGEPHVIHGERVFASLGCAACHLPDMKTAASASLPELSNRTFHPYTDLLLHDMGPALADGRPDALATGSEWRTAPLWGLGLLQTVNGHTRLLHDGRARNAEEAILWHGGEAEKARDAYKSLPADDRKALLRFLDSL
ncbi:MAG: di-heme oxidoredictase family protein [Verrucomicrobiales bacterium]